MERDRKGRNDAERAEREGTKCYGTVWNGSERDRQGWNGTDRDGTGNTGTVLGREDRNEAKR